MIKTKVFDNGVIRIVVEQSANGYPVMVTSALGSYELDDIIKIIQLMDEAKLYIREYINSRIQEANNNLQEGRMTDE